MSWHPSADTDGSDDEESEEDDETTIGALAPTQFVIRKAQQTAFSKAPDATYKAGFKGPESEYENWKGAQLLAEYRRAPTPEKMEHLLAHYDQLIETDIRRHARKSLPEPAIRAAAYNAFAKSVKSYAPDKYETVKQFHNFHSQEGGGRDLANWANSYSSFVKIPKNRAATLERLRIAATDLQMESDESPTAELIHERVPEISLKQIRKFMPELGTFGAGSKNLRSDYVVDEDALYRRAITQVRDNLYGADRALFEDLFGSVFGKPQKNESRGALARRHNLSASKLSKQQAKYKAMIQTEMQTIQRGL